VIGNAELVPCNIGKERIFLRCDGIPSDEAQLLTPDTYFVARLAETAGLPDLNAAFAPPSIRLGGTATKDRSMPIGTVKFFSTQKGFGFISREEGGKDVFVHISAVEASGMSTLAEGQRVSFDVQPDKRGEKAVNLKLA
jgi:cold shock protein